MTTDTPIAEAATSTSATPATDGHSWRLTRRPAIAARNIELPVLATSPSCPCCFAKTSLMSRRRLFIPVPPGDGRPEPAARPIDSRFRGGRRDTERGGDLFYRQAQVEVQKERASVSQRELLHGAFEVKMFDLRLPRGGTDHNLSKRCQPEPWRTPHIAALVGHDREEPRAYRHSRPELVHFAPGAGQRLLGGVLGIPTIPQHRQSEPQPGLDQGSEE